MVASLDGISFGDIYTLNATCYLIGNDQPVDQHSHHIV